MMVLYALTTDIMHVCIRYRVKGEIELYRVIPNTHALYSLETHLVTGESGFNCVCSGYVLIEEHVKA
jgi:hypothetical protein